MGECIFCSKDKIKTKFIYEDETVMAFLDIEPINAGHILLVPKEHYLDADEIPEDIFVHLMRVSKRIIKAIKEVCTPDGYSIMQNGGEFNDIGHYHLHIFPRYKGDGFGWTGGNGYIETADIAEKIKEKLKQ